MTLPSCDVVAYLMRVDLDLVRLVDGVDIELVETQQHRAGRERAYSSTTSYCNFTTHLVFLLYEHVDTYCYIQP